MNRTCTRLRITLPEGRQPVWCRNSIAQHPQKKLGPQEKTPPHLPQRKHELEGARIECNEIRPTEIKKFPKHIILPVFSGLDNTQRTRMGQTMHMHGGHQLATANNATASSSSHPTHKAGETSNYMHNPWNNNITNTRGTTPLERNARTKPIAILTMLHNMNLYCRSTMSARQYYCKQKQQCHVECEFFSPQFGNKATTKIGIEQNRKDGHSLPRAYLTE